MAPPETTNELRSAFLEFFAGKAHLASPGVSLVPRDSALFVTTCPDFPHTPRTAVVQKCLRADLESPDLEQVGHLPAQLTFFELLGIRNTDRIARDEALQWANEFLTRILQLPKESLLQQDAGDGTTFVFDFGRTYCKKPDCQPGCTCGRFLPLWSFEFKETGLKAGMGLERLAMAVQRKRSAFETDQLAVLVQAVWDVAGGDTPRELPQRIPPGQALALHVVVDHMRALTFALAEGVLPATEGRGAVLRRLLRRAVRFARTLSLEGPFLYNLVSRTVSAYQNQYPELKERREHIAAALQVEEEHFHNTFRRGRNALLSIFNHMKHTKQKVLSGEQAFLLATSHGFPVELTREAALEAGFSLDEPGYARLKERHRTDSTPHRARATREPGARCEAAMRFAELSLDTVMRVREARDGQLQFTLEQTPFYPEGGGQAPDTGQVTGPGFTLQVSDVQRSGDSVLHTGRLLKGNIPETGDPLPVRAQVDKNARLATARHHTATHLLQAALRRILGPHVRQAGSWVTADRLRFDFTHSSALRADLMGAIEEEVNGVILSNWAVSDQELGYDEAVAAGALAFFGEKYQQRVRVITIGDYSTELCGGTHVGATGEIGLLALVSESSVASGVRRVEALAGHAARAYLARTSARLADVALTLKVGPEQVIQRVEDLLDRDKALARKLRLLQDTMADRFAAPGEVQVVGGVQLITRDLGELDADGCRSVADRLLSSLGSGVVVVGSRIRTKACLIAKLSEDLAGKGLKAHQIVERSARFMDGSGGGTARVAEAGGRSPERLPMALAKVPDVLRELLA
jgi:alanyl-tRNA synthetase